MFVVPTIFKLLSDPLWAAEFAQHGLGTWFMYAVAVIQIGAAH
jgi:hypothetical protein